jgi:hypothetical protein
MLSPNSLREKFGRVMKIRTLGSPCVQRPEGFVRHAEACR